MATLSPIYSVVKDSNADLGVIFRFLQNSPITKAGCTKISKKQDRRYSDPKACIS